MPGRLRKLRLNGCLPFRRRGDHHLPGESDQHLRWLHSRHQHVLLSSVKCYRLQVPKVEGKRPQKPIK